jgi:hypothetical protein
MMFNSLPSLQYPTFKLGIVLLLGINIFLYAFTDTLTNAVDEVAWLSLLILYELKANGIAFAPEDTLNKARDALIVAIILVFFSYAKSQEWLDAINFLLWIALIALLEVEVRRPELILNYPKFYWWSKVSIFSGLIGMVVAWAYHSEWLDMYDAALWLIAFITIESDIHQFLQRNSG